MKIDDDVFITVEKLFIKKLIRPVEQACQDEVSAGSKRRRKNSANKAAEQAPSNNGRDRTGGPASKENYIESLILGGKINKIGSQCQRPIEMSAALDPVCPARYDRSRSRSRSLRSTEMTLRFSDGLALLFAAFLMTACTPQAPTEQPPPTPAPTAVLEAGRNWGRRCRSYSPKVPPRMPKGNVYFSEIRGNRILKHSPGGGWTEFRNPSRRANGLAFDQEGRLIACEGAAPGGRTAGHSHRPDVRRSRSARGAV